MSIVELIDFLNARLVEDEASVAEFDARIWDAGLDLAGYEVTDDQNGNRCIRVGKARVLAEVEAKRRILDEVMPALDDLNPEWPDDRPHHTDLLAVLKLLALPYVGHPDFREEWKP